MTEKNQTSEVLETSEVCAFATQLVAEKTVRIDIAVESLQGMNDDD